MAFSASSLHLRAGAPGDCMYHYRTSADTMAQVSAVGYFHNATYSTALAAEDIIFARCTDGNVWLRVSAVSAAGSVTTQFAGGDLPLNTAATGTEAALSAAIIPGYMEVGSSISTATRYVLPTPYKGAPFLAVKVDSGTQGFEFDAGGSGATGVTFDGSNRRIKLLWEGESFHVRGSSTSRWRIQQLTQHGSAVSEGASVFMPGT